MDNQTKKLLAAAVVGGYVLGRTKKGRLALTAATFLAGKKLTLSPRQLVAEGVRRLGDVPQVAELQEQLRAQGLDAGRQVLSTIANRGMDSLADAIHERATGLAGPALGEQDENGEDEEKEIEPDGEYDEEPEEEEGEEEVAELPRRRKNSSPAKKTAAKKTAHAKKKPAERSAPAKKAPAKKAAPVKKTALSQKRAAKKTSTRSDGRR
jgi:hypothetical protein